MLQPSGSQRGGRSFSAEFRISTDDFLNTNRRHLLSVTTAPLRNKFQRVSEDITPRHITPRRMKPRLLMPLLSRIRPKLSTSHTRSYRRRLLCPKADSKTLSQSYIQRKSQEASWKNTWRKDPFDNVVRPAFEGCGGWVRRRGSGFAAAALEHPRRCRAGVKAATRKVQLQSSAERPIAASTDCTSCFLSSTESPPTPPAGRALKAAKARDLSEKLTGAPVSVRPVALCIRGRSTATAIERCKIERLG